MFSLPKTSLHVILTLEDVCIYLSTSGKTCDNWKNELPPICDSMEKKTELLHLESLPMFSETDSAPMSANFTDG